MNYSMQMGKRKPSEITSGKKGCSTRSQVSRRDNGSGKRFSGIPGSVHKTLNSPGRPMPEDLASEMGSRLGFDFSGVRIHDDASAHRSASDIGADAYAAGRHVVFGGGQYSPGTASGQRLLAHELAHVVQQGATEPSGTLEMGAPGTHLESQADRMAESAMSPRAKSMGGFTNDSVSSGANGSPGVVQRSCSDGACDSCAGGMKDLWITVFFRRRATRHTMDHIRAQINGAKAVLRNCCVNIKFDFDWRLLRGPATAAAPPARPAGDPNGALDYSDDLENLGEGATFTGARGIPMLVVDDITGTGGGVTVTGGVDLAYTGPNYFVIAVNQTGANNNCNHIAHELWHVAGNFRHDAAEGPITACDSNVVSDTFCQAIRTLS